MHQCDVLRIQIIAGKQFDARKVLECMYKCNAISDWIMSKICNNTEDPRYSDSVCYQRFGSNIEFVVIKKLDMDLS